MNGEGQIVLSHNSYTEGDEDKLFENVRKLAKGEKTFSLIILSIILLQKTMTIKFTIRLLLLLSISFATTYRLHN